VNWFRVCRHQVNFEGCAYKATDLFLLWCELKAWLACLHYSQEKFLAVFEGLKLGFKSFKALIVPPKSRS
jgi:hypothetical protein